MATESITSNTQVGSATGAATAASGTSSSNADALANKEVFLQLLVAQIKYQNPLSPADSMQYITQLSQFTGVEQLVEIKNDIKALNDKFTAAPDPTAGK
jgi:flagellar basal-body rod modification protein FlgD